jgi:hypothetical protein
VRCRNAPLCHTPTSSAVTLSRTQAFLPDPPNVDLLQSYGDPVTLRDPADHICIAFQNVKGLTYSATGEDYYDYYLLHISSIDSNITGMAETNTAWAHPHLRSAFTSRAKGHLTIDPMPETESYQAGGATTFSSSNMAPFLLARSSRIQLV